MRFFVIIMAVLFCAGSFADVIPPDFAGCQNKNAGDSCKTELNSDGNCILVKNAICRYNPSSGKTCTDALKCLPPANNADARANLNGSTNAVGCSNQSN